jgi:hypothetical protein
MLGVAVRAETKCKAEKMLEDAIARIGRFKHHSAMTIVIAAADACRFVVTTALPAAVQRIGALLGQAAHMLQAPLPARLQPETLARLRAASMVAMLAKAPDLRQFPDDGWVAEALTHSARLGFSYTDGCLHRRGVQVDPRSVTPSLLMSESAPMPDAERDLVMQTLHATGPRKGMSDRAYEWVASSVRPEGMTQRLCESNGKRQCVLCERDIGPNHPLTCCGVASAVVMRPYTHEAVAQAMGAAVTKAGIGRTLDCGVGGGGGSKIRPDMQMGDVWVEVKTVVSGGHRDPMAELRKKVAEARRKYAAEGHGDVLVIGVTTRGRLSSACREDLAALQKKIADEEWRPTPGVDTAVGAAVAEANANRWSVWTERVTYARG